MIAKWLLMALLLAVAYGLWRSKQRAAQRAAQTPRPTGPTLTPPQTMLRCTHCGLHLPQSEAIFAHGHAYCSSAHAQQGAQPPQTTPAQASEPE